MQAKVLTGDCDINLCLAHFATFLNFLSGWDHHPAVFDSAKLILFILIVVLPFKIYNSLFFLTGLNQNDSLLKIETQLYLLYSRNIIISILFSFSYSILFF